MFFVSPEIAFNKLEDDKPHQERNTINTNPSRQREDRDKIKKEENKYSSFSIGLLVEYAISKKWSLQSGIGYTKINSEIKPKKVFAEPNAFGEIKYKNNCSFGTTYINPKTGILTNIGDSVSLATTNNTLNYISLPLNIAYHFKIKKLSISPTIGVAANILVKQSTITNIEGEAPQKANNIEGINKNYFNANLGFGIDYFIRKNISITAMPNIRIGLNPLNRNSNVKMYNNTAGILLGLKYKF